MSNANRIWLRHYSVEPWLSSSLWNSYLQRAEELVGERLTHLDTNDPVRREVAGPAEAAEFCVSFGGEETSRWLFGRFGSSRIGFEIRHFREIDASPNAIRWHFPEDWSKCERAPEVLDALFAHGIRDLQSFYAYGDVVDWISQKKKPSGAVNLERELVGAFWLTYFDHRYADWLSFGALGEEDVRPTQGDRGITLKLADSPWECSIGCRDEIEALLGRDAFVDPEQTTLKPPGRFVPTLIDLRDGDGGSKPPMSSRAAR